MTWTYGLQGLESVILADQTPQPQSPPLADDAPDMLRRFIYYLTRDFIPFGVIDHAMSRARSENYPLPDGDVREYADKTARELVYVPPSG